MNPFEIFKITESYNLDKNKLETEYVLLLAKHHPDNFEGRESLFESAFCVKINDAYLTLKNDMLRAKFLLEKNGIIIDGKGKNIKIDVNFIEHIMCLNEKLIADKESAILEIEKLINQCKAEIDVAFNEKNFLKAGEILLKIIYLDGIKKHNLLLK